ncbi:sulfotransferase family 2 domain-containing protein [cf. Phormidesmis sp. LEGE 11477]|uniref:sulfotransferase family 2 domain-containing protein n=1 Tax=cf. Phormidesmis sp. LEGE 11477 TaxID=1828680 RepID=UPI0018813D53|nr:sulfotransferase family 2 domain-containing protein [cf. Phormidesmis sp. LEGE 11477]MBE9060264.1 sulfotransferase family 2 domain-containing protein [cf. Phormidesmis sp. LEGE 11477]
MTRSLEKFIIFLHIQKTGGITIQRILRRELGPSLSTRVLRAVSAERQSLSLEKAASAKRFEDGFFVGHCCFGIQRYLPQPFTYITMLREPVSRVISLYYYSIDNPTAYYHRHAVNKSLEEFALNTQLMELDNGQVRFIAGDEKSLFINRTPIGECNTDLLETAKENIDQHFSFVGLTEQFDQSMLLLYRMMGWSQSSYLRRNSAKEASRPTVSKRTRQLIAEKNNLDVELYKHVHNRFHQLLSRYGLDDEKLLKRFQIKNQMYRALWGIPYEKYDAFKALFKS